MSEILSSTPAPAELEAAQTYFYGRFRRNHQGEAGAMEARRIILGIYLAQLGQGHWFGAGLSRVDIYTPPVGHWLASDSRGRERTQLTRYMRDKQEVRREQKGHLFAWTVTPVSMASGGQVIFQDSVSGDIGVYDRNWTSTYAFQEDQERALAVVENLLGEVFYPNSVSRHYSQVRPFEIVPRDESTA